MCCERDGDSFFFPSFVLEYFSFLSYFFPPSHHPDRSQSSVDHFFQDHQPRAPVFLGSVFFSFPPSEALFAPLSRRRFILVRLFFCRNFPCFDLPTMMAFLSFSLSPFFSASPAPLV